MKSQATLFGHAIHPILVVFPLGLFTASVAFDIGWLLSDRPNFPVAAAFTIAAGGVGAVAAAIFGLVDWASVPGGTRARRLGLWHGLGNAVVLVIFAASFLIRYGQPGWEPTGWAYALSFTGVALGGIAGWMGGELVERLGIGVHEGAHPDAPSSLSRAPTASMDVREPQPEPESRPRPPGPAESRR